MEAEPVAGGSAGLTAGIPLLVPGEVFTRKVVDSLKFSREFNANCPGFETDVHGLVSETDENGKVRYFADCVKA